MYKIKRYFQGVLKQAKMVRWPKKADLVSAFAVVLTVIAFSSIALTLDNFVISKLLQALEDQFGAAEGATSAALRTLFNLF